MNFSCTKKLCGKSAPSHACAALPAFEIRALVHEQAAHRHMTWEVMANARVIARSSRKAPMNLQISARYRSVLMPIPRATRHGSDTLNTNALMF